MKHRFINVGGRLMDLSRPQVMGILNVTPDSFYGASRHTTEEGIAERVRQIVEEGATIIDVGAYSSRPGADDVSEAEEMERLRLALKVVRSECPDAVVSVDTFRSGVARMCVEEYGVDIINDISGGEMDGAMFRTVAQLGVPYVLMHMKGTPADMQTNPHYDNLVGEVVAYFAERVQRLRDLGFYTKKVDAYKSDIAKLNSSINLMAQNGCDNDSIYFVYAKAAYDLQPTFASSIGLAQKAQKDGKATEALSYYDKALELASDDATRGKICIKVAQALISSGGFTKGEEFINKAIEYNPALKGAAYWQMAMSLIKAHDLKGAVGYCDLAGEADITYANRAADMKKRLNEAIQQQATNAKMQAEYNEYMRKKKAEEDFWNQK